MSERRKTVLIVDDDEGMRETLSAVLRRDYRLLKAATGEAALQIMEKEDILSCRNVSDSVDDSRVPDVK